MRQTSWDQPVPPSRSGATSASQGEDSLAFASQFDEVDRAIDNLVKSGKFFPGPRRDSMPMMIGRPYTDYDPRLLGGIPPQRHHSVSDFDPTRMHPAAGLQGYYATQRFQGRPAETDQMLQAKRRMAAQRERELRNYHQEQQYNRSLLAEMSGNRSDRSLSPAAMSEEGRRELLARQHRALYGNDSPAFFPPASSFSGDDAHSARGENATSGTPASTNNAVRGPSPRGTDPFAPSEPLVPGATANSSAPGTAAAAGSGAGGRQSPSRANSASSPNAGTKPSYGLYDSTAEQPVTSTSSPGGKDSPSRTLSSGPIGSVGPIGSRPSQPATSQASNSGLGSSGNERLTSSASNPANNKESNNPLGLGWSNSSGVWGSKNIGVPASVWG